VPPARRLILASASPSRRRLLEQAGIAFDMVVSGVDEDTVAAASPAQMVLALAEAKARAVASRAGSAAALVLGCDSLLDIDGVAEGKPASAQEAVARLRVLRNRSAILRTGHCLIDTGAGKEVAAVASTVVWFGNYDDDELNAYVATGEPLEVAGAFTLDGYAAPFTRGIEGDHSNVIGLSLPLLRDLLGELGVRVYDLWR
jgi:septum formation protein